MSKTTLTLTAMFVLLILAQAVVFNNLILMNTAMAFVFVYFIAAMPAAMGTAASLTAGFGLGLAVDIFSDTAGLNTLACTLVTFMRKPLLFLYVPRDEELTDGILSVKTLGRWAYFRYLFTLVIIYCFAVFGIESFSFFDPVRQAIRAGASTVYTFTVIYALDTVIHRRREKKL